MQLDKFENERMLVLEPPHGEFVLMNFHIGALRHEGQIPFRVMPTLAAVTDYKQELRLQIRAEFPEKYHGANVKVTFTVPRSSTGATVELMQGAKLQTWVQRYGTRDGAQIFAVVEDVSESLAVAAMHQMRRAFEARRSRGQAQSGSKKMTLTAIHDTGVYETRPCDAKGTPYGASTFSLLADEPVVTHGDVVLRNDERARRANGVAGGVPPDELQTLRGNKVLFAVEKQRAVDHTPVRTFRYEKRHTFVDGRFSTEMTKVWEGATAEEAKVAQPEFEIEIKYCCGGHERPARHPADTILIELADLIRHTTAPALVPARGAKRR